MFRIIMSSQFRSRPRAQKICKVGLRPWLSSVEYRKKSDLIDIGIDQPEKGITAREKLLSRKADGHANVSIGNTPTDGIENYSARFLVWTAIIMITKVVHKPNGFHSRKTCSEPGTMNNLVQMDSNFYCLHHGNPASRLGAKEENGKLSPQRGARAPTSAERERVAVRGAAAIGSGRFLLKRERTGFRLSGRTLSQ